jgi:hypothetical protein
MESKKTWTKIPELRLRQYGRIGTWSDLTEEEAYEVIEKGPYDANVTAFNFDALENIQTYGECYK